MVGLLYLYTLLVTLGNAVKVLQDCLGSYVLSHNITKTILTCVLQVESLCCEVLSWVPHDGLQQQCCSFVVIDKVEIL